MANLLNPWSVPVPSDDLVVKRYLRDLDQPATFGEGPGGRRERLAKIPVEFFSSSFLVYRSETDIRGGVGGSEWTDVRTLKLSLYGKVDHHEWWFWRWQTVRLFFEFTWNRRAGYCAREHFKSHFEYEIDWLRLGMLINETNKWAPNWLTAAAHSLFAT